MALVEDQEVQGVYVRTPVGCTHLGKVVEGFCDLSGVSAFTLVSTHHSSSMISSDFALASGFRVTCIMGFREVKIYGKIHKIRPAKVCYKLEVKAGGYKWPVDPVFGFTGAYDLILGKDWLEKNYALLDRMEKTVKFWPPGEHPMRAMFRQKNEGTLKVLTILEDFNRIDEAITVASPKPTSPLLPSCCSGAKLEFGYELEEEDPEDPIETFFGGDNEEVDREFSYD